MSEHTRVTWMPGTERQKKCNNLTDHPGHLWTDQHGEDANPHRYLCRGHNTAWDRYEEMELDGGEHYGQAFPVMCDEIDQLREENSALFQESVASNNELARQLRENEELGDYCERLRMELSRHGWGDMHYLESGIQDPAIVALLTERGTNGSKLVETIDINTEPNVFERDPESGTERAEIHTTNTQTPIANYKFPWNAD